jgi:hypothetical protein
MFGRAAALIRARPDDPRPAAFSVRRGLCLPSFKPPVEIDDDEFEVWHQACEAGSPEF